MRAMLAVCAALLLSAGCSGAPGDPAGTTPGGTPTGRATDGGAPVDIGSGRQLYLECHGTGSPTVVLVSGFRGAHDDWTSVLDAAGEPRPSGAAVFPQVAGFTRVCAYDRPGTTMLGGTPTVSTPVTQPTTAQDGARDLHALLAAGGPAGPYVLVAHSWGGLIAHSFATTYPDDVAGLVLVDAGSELLQSALTPAQWSTFATAAARPGEPASLEAADYERSVAAIRAAAPVPPVPAVVLTSDHPFDFGAGEGTWPAWLLAQARLATTLHATHLTETGSGHFIHGERPELVVDAVRGVVSGPKA